MSQDLKKCMSPDFNWSYQISFARSRRVSRVPFSGALSTSPGPPIFPSPPHHMTDSSVQVLRQGFSSHREEQEAQESQEEQEEHLIIKEEPEEQPEDLSIVHPNDVKILEQQN